MEINDRKKYCEKSNIEATRFNLSNQWQLKVLGGIHRGARVSLKENDLVIVGHAHDCEIVLQDQGVEAHHVAIMVRANRLVLKPLDGVMHLNGCELGSDKLDLIGTNKLSLVNTDVELEIFSAKESTQNQTGSEAQIEDSGQIDPDKKSNVSRLVWAMCTLVLLGAVAGTGRFTLAGKDDLANIDTPQKNIDQIIDELQVGGQLSIIDTSKGKLIKGILDEQQKAELESRLINTRFPVLFNTITPPQLLEQVSNVFRINGYQAQLRYQGGARVAVENLDGTLDAVKKIAAYIKQDVPSLLSLEFDKQQSNPVADIQPELEIDPDKKMTTIVDGDIAYISTVDGARYFSGSILPGGYTVSKITVNGVKVTRDNEAIWLKF